MLVEQFPQGSDHFANHIREHSVFVGENAEAQRDELQLNGKVAIDGVVLLPLVTLVVECLDSVHELHDVVYVCSSVFVLEEVVGNIDQLEVDGATLGAGNVEVEGSEHRGEALDEGAHGLDLEGPRVLGVFEGVEEFGVVEWDVSVSAVQRVDEVDQGFLLEEGTFLGHEEAVELLVAKFCQVVDLRVSHVNSRRILVVLVEILKCQVVEGGSTLLLMLSRQMYHFLDLRIGLLVI